MIYQYEQVIYNSIEKGGSLTKIWVQRLSVQMSYYLELRKCLFMPPPRVAQDVSTLVGKMKNSSTSRWVYFQK